MGQSIWFARFVSECIEKLNAVQNKEEIDEEKEKAKKTFRRTINKAKLTSQDMDEMFLDEDFD